MIVILISMAFFPYLLFRAGWVKTSCAYLAFLVSTIILVFFIMFGMLFTFMNGNSFTHYTMPPFLTNLLFAGELDSFFATNLWLGAFGGYVALIDLYNLIFWIMAKHANWTIKFFALIGLYYYFQVWKLYCSAFFPSMLSWKEKESDNKKWEVVD